MDLTIGYIPKNFFHHINPMACIFCYYQTKRPGKSEVNRLLGSNEKILRLTNWKQQYSLDMGLKSTIEFLRNNLNRYKINIYNI